jgi:hypothetical protein
METQCVASEDLTVLDVKRTVFCAVTKRSFVNRFQRFEGNLLPSSSGQKDYY